MPRRILSLLLLTAVLAAALPLTGGAEMTDPALLPENDALPELMRFADGTPVETPEDWARRREEILALYARYVYGAMPDPAGETVAWALEEDAASGGTLLKVTVEANGKRGELAALVTLPEGTPPWGGWPFFLEYMPWDFSFGGQHFSGPSANCVYAASRGYAGINYDPSKASMDNGMHIGAFYRLYPYDIGKPAEQRGVLLAWAWGVSKIIDALEAGAGEALGINPALSLVGGVSRWGKSAAVAGAYDTRIRVTIPSCSGLGGVAVFRTNNSGKTYDLTRLGGPAAWTNTSANEPFSNLKGGEGYWFCGAFARVPNERCLPVDQHMLCALIAGADRHLITVTGITSEGWNNTEGQCLAWLAAQPAWDLLGAGGQNHILIHLDGHAILREDMAAILDYCDARLLGRPGPGPESPPMGAEVFLEDNRSVLDPAFDPYLSR